MREIGKIFRFCGAHTLPSHQGKCRNLHGHNWKLEVRLSGPVDSQQSSPRWGMIMDFGELKSLVNEVVIEYHDHKYLNEIYPNPTAENMVAAMAEALQEKLPNNIILTRVKLWETEDSYAIWHNTTV